MKRSAPFLILALCLLVFYGPMFLSAGTVVTGLEDDPGAHLLNSLGDHRPGGRFFHYFDLAANTRLWGQDVIFHPLHLIRLISIGLGSGLAGWGILLMGIHSFLFGVVYHYSRTVLRVTQTAGLTGAAAAFFSLSWAEWIETAYWMPAAVLLAVSLGEYWLFLKTARRRHLLACVLANVLQPYLSVSSVLVPTQVYLFGAVVLMALYRRRPALKDAPPRASAQRPALKDAPPRASAQRPALKDAPPRASAQGTWGQTVYPCILFVWPLTALGWAPILAPMFFSLGSGLVARYSAKELAWGLNGSVFTGLLGFLCPSPAVAGDLLSKVGWYARVQSPNNFLFGSFLFIPSILALGRSGQRALWILLVGMAFYIGSLAAAEFIQVPSPLIRGLGFTRAFLFPLLSGFVVAAGIGLREFGRSDALSTRILHRLYLLLWFGAAVTLISLCALNAEQLAHWASRWELVGSGTRIPFFLRGTRAWAAGIVLGLAGYFGYRAALRSSALRSAALCVAIAAPTLGFGYGQGWYAKQPGLDAALSPPSEFQFLRKRIPSYEYRIGLVLASYVRLAQGDSKGFWDLVYQRENVVLSYLLAYDLDLRQGLAFALPSLHFYATVQSRLQADGNPFLQRPESPKTPVLNRGNVIGHPEAKSFEEYGVRYWLSNFDLQSLYPGQFNRVYRGEYADVFENKNAKPVAFFLEEPRAPLALEHLRYGIAVRFPRPKGGRLSLHVDLRGMKARAVGPEGRITPLALQSSGFRWEVDVPPGSSAVLFTTVEAVPLQWLATGSGAAFVLWALAGIRRR